jgi:hypothetical protein
VIVADAGNALVRQVTARSRLPTLPPASPLIAPAVDWWTFALTPLLWPVEPLAGPHEIAGTMGEPRGDPGGTGYDRLHAGIDVRVPAGTPVVHVRPAGVRQPVSTGGFDLLTEWLNAGLVSYVHVRVGRDARGRLVDPERYLPVYDEGGTLVRVRVRRGTRFDTGDPVGTVNRFNHVHLAVGPPGEEINPLLMRLPRFDDRVAPTIPRGGIRIFAEDGTLLARRGSGRVVVRGRLRVVVEAWDRADASPLRRRLGIYRLGYQVLDEGGTPVPGFEMFREAVMFDRLGRQADTPALLYAPGSGIPFYRSGRTRFLYQVTNSYRAGRGEQGWLDVSTLTPGFYTLRVLVADFNGNEATANRDLPLDVRP